MPCYYGLRATRMFRTTTTQKKIILARRGHQTALVLVQYVETYEQNIRAHVLCMKWAFSCWGQFLWCIQKNDKKTGFVFVRVKIVMHGLTVTQEFCKLSNVHICSFVCLTFVDASMESLMMNFHRTLDASNVQVLTIAIAVVFCIFSSKCTSPLWFCWLGTTMTGTYKFSAANSKYSACAPSTNEK